MVNTAHLAWRTTRSVTLPMSQRCKPERPAVAMTTRSMSFSST